MRIAFPLVFVLALVGCRGNRESDVVGSWSSPSGMSVTTNADKTFSNKMGPMSIDGTWSVAGDEATFTPKTLNGKSIAELKSNLQRNAAAIPAQAKRFVDDLDKPNVMRLSSDGKTMTTDKAKDTNTGAAITLTKS